MRPDFAVRFANWLAWCLGRVTLPGLIAISAESGYAGPQGKGTPTGWGDYDLSSLPPKPVRLHIDHTDALEVNRAYTALPEQQRLAIKLIWFKPHIRPQRAAQIIGCHYTQLPEVAHKARRALQERLAGRAFGRSDNGFGGDNPIPADFGRALDPPL